MPHRTDSAIEHVLPLNTLGVTQVSKKWWLVGWLRVCDDESLDEECACLSCGSYALALAEIVNTPGYTGKFPSLFTACPHAATDPGAGGDAG